MDSLSLFAMSCYNNESRCKPLALSRGLELEILHLDFLFGTTTLCLGLSQIASLTGLSSELLDSEGVSFYEGLEATHGKVGRWFG